LYGNELIDVGDKKKGEKYKGILKTNALVEVQFFFNVIGFVV